MWRREGEEELECFVKLALPKIPSISWQIIGQRRFRRLAPSADAGTLASSLVRLLPLNPFFEPQEASRGRVGQSHMTAQHRTEVTVRCRSQMSQSDVTSGLDIADVSCCVPLLRLESSKLCCLERRAAKCCASLTIMWFTDSDRIGTEFSVWVTTVLLMSPLLWRSCAANKLIVLLSRETDHMVSFP